MTYDDGTDEKYEFEVMDGSREELEKAVIGRRIVSVEKVPYPSDRDWMYYGRSDAVALTLDDGSVVYISDTDDCCAYTSVEDFKFLEKSDNVVTSVTADEAFEKWFIYADGIPVVDLDVAWSPGNPYYYGFGFEIKVVR